MEKKSCAVSDITTHAMSASLKELMARKGLDKITIREIADGCGMKRQNFYYHFEDIYGLVKWMFQEEASLSSSSTRGPALAGRTFATAGGNQRHARGTGPVCRYDAAGQRSFH